MHAMNAVSSVNQPQNDRKSVVFCKRPARMELFRDAVFASRRIAPSLTGRQSFFFDLTSQARGVCPLPNDTTIQCKLTVVLHGAVPRGVTPRRVRRDATRRAKSNAVAVHSYSGVAQLGNRDYTYYMHECCVLWRDVVTSGVREVR